MNLTLINIKDSKSFIFQTVIIFIVLISASLQSKPYIILDGESPYTLPQKSIEARLMAGYETGYIPDYFIRPWIDLGITDRLTFGGGVYYTWFPDQDKSRISEWELRGKIKLLDLSIGNIKSISFEGMPIFGYVKFRKSDEAIIAPYSGSAQNIIAVVSPRADGGWDLTAGLSTRLEFKISGQGFGIFSTADYSWTGGRDYYPDGLAYQNRFTVNIMPLYYINFLPARYVNKDSLFFGIQNRFTYWFDRGNMYNVMPQVSWEINKNMALSAGVNIPVSSENDYRYLVEFSVKFEHAPLTAKINVNPGEDFTPDGNGLNDYLYLEPSISSNEEIREWTITIKDDKKTIKIFSGKGKPESKITWDGSADGGEKVKSLNKYTVSLRATDVKGRTEKDNTSFTTGLLLEKIENGYRIVLSNIEFDTGKDIIKKNAYPVLDIISAQLNDQYKNYSVKIEGHTDNVGGTENNQKLSVKRAESVMNYLVKKGISKNRMSANGFGETVPIADNSTDEGKARNRRVEFILQKK